MSLPVRCTWKHCNQAYREIASCAFKEYVALGDSYSAGVNADPQGELPICSSIGAYPFVNCTTRRCGGNTGAYAYQFYQSHQPRHFTFLACGGDGTDQCAKVQVPNIPSSADLVTITIGGNNGGAFSDVVTKCVYLRAGIFSFCARALANAQNVVANIASALDELLRQVKAAAPGARVVVFGYVRFWPNEDNPEQCQSKTLKNPSSEQKTAMNALVWGMNRRLEEAAVAHGFAFVDVDGRFDGHRLCDVGESYIQWELQSSIPGIEDDLGDDDEIVVDDPRAERWNHGFFHPFEAGQVQYRIALEEALGC